MKKITVFVLAIALIFSSATLISCESTSQNPNSASGSNKPLEKSYTVRFDTNGGTKIPSATLNVLEKIPEPTKNGYLFDGWYQDSTLTTSVAVPFTLEGDTTLYAKWLNLKDSINCTGTTLKCWEGSNSQATWKISPNNLDLERLAERGYSYVEIEVTYCVRYQKDYSVPLDIGYAGAPKYTIGILDSNDRGRILDDLSTTKSKEKRSVTDTLGISELKNDQIYLKCMTANIQNKVIFSDITVTYTCLK